MTPKRCSVVVGRERQRAALDTAWTEASAGRLRIVVLRGEPGIGKTTLVDAAAERYEQGGGLILWGACVPEGEAALPFAPLRDALQPLAESFEQLRHALSGDGDGSSPAGQTRLFES